MPYDHYNESNDYCIGVYVQKINDLEHNMFLINFYFEFMISKL